MPPSLPPLDEPGAMPAADQQQLVLALRASHAGTWQSEIASERIFCDLRSREILGLPADGAISFADFTARVHEDDRESLSALFEETIAGNDLDVWDVQFRVVHDDGAVVWVHGLGHVDRDADGRATRLVGLNIDITERKRVEQALRATTADVEAHARELEVVTAQLRRLASDLTLAEQRAREQLAHTLHDGVQQLMFGASLRIEQLVTRQRAAGASDADLRLLVRARNDIEEAIVAARSLAVELFPPVLRDRSLPDALVWLAGWMREKYNLVVDIQADAGGDPDSAEVRTLLFDSVRELLFNVVKHAGVPQVAVSIHVGDDGRLHITVTDHGVGLPPRRRRSDEDGGTGLGLRSIRERLTLLGGRLAVDTAPGRGARFELIAPLAGGRASEAAAPVRRAPAPVGTSRRRGETSVALRVLVVDDHEYVREGLSQLLGAQTGLQVVGEARDGVEAVTMAMELRPDVIVMDVSMPRMDGVEATRRIRARLPGVRIVVLSAEAAVGSRHPIEDAGADAYIQKGETSGQLVDWLQALARARERA